MIILLTPVILILVACLLVLDFFGTTSVDGYVTGNMMYAEQYRQVLNENITKNNNGYVSLERILYFYLAKDSLSFSEIYEDNINKNLGKMKPIFEACSMPKYTNFADCHTLDIKYRQFEDYDTKVFVPPIDFSKTTITSFFKEERIVYGEFSVHDAWDFAAPAETEVYSSCSGIVTNVSFKYQENKNDLKGGIGNTISIKCDDTSEKYTVSYGHLFPNSSKVKIGDEVVKGQTIATVGTTGYSTGNHLDWKVSLNGKYIDGMSLIDFRYDEDVENKGDSGGGYYPPGLRPGASMIMEIKIFSKSSHSVRHFVPLNIYYKINNASFY